MLPAIRVSFTLLAFAGVASRAEAQPSTKPTRATGIVCNEGGSGNRGVWLEIDSHNRYMTDVTVGGLDAGFVKTFFPDHRATPTAATVSLAIPLGLCMPDETGASSVVSCTAATATASTASLTYYLAPDEISIRRSIEVTHVKIDLAKNAAGAVSLALSFDATVRGRKVKYAFTKALGTLQQRRGPSDLGGPTQGCAVTDGVSAAKLR